MAETEKVTLGSGVLYLNGVDVGHLKGDVEFSYTVERVEFKPADMLGVVKVFKIREGAQLKAASAELKMANIKLAMGVTTAVDASVSFPSYVGAGDSCSISMAAGQQASYSYDVLHFGGSKAVDEMCLRFDHTRPNGQVFTVIFYNAVSMSELIIPFHEEDITLYDLTFKALSDANRAAGDRIGVLIEEVGTPI